MQKPEPEFLTAGNRETCESPTGKEGRFLPRKTRNTRNYGEPEMSNVEGRKKV